jgi:hypothetical protein
VSPRRNDYCVVVQKLHLQVIRGFFRTPRLYAVQHAIISSLTQRQEYLRVIDHIGVHLDAGILLGKPENDIRQDREPRPLHAADLHFSCGRIGKELDVPDDLLQIIERPQTVLAHVAEVYPLPILALGS